MSNKTMNQAPANEISDEMLNDVAGGAATMPTTTSATLARVPTSWTTDPHLNLPNGQNARPSRHQA